MLNIDFLNSNQNLFSHIQKNYVFDNVTVSTKTGPYRSLPLLSNPQGSIIPETLDEPLYWHPSPLPLGRAQVEVEADIEFRKKLFKSYYDEHQLSSSKCLEIDSKCVWLGHSHGWYPYGHLHDSLSRLFGIRNLLEDTNLTFLCSNWNRVTDFHDHLNACVGREVNKKSIIRINDYDLIKCSQLIFSLPSSAATNFTKECQEWLHSSYLSHFKIEYDAACRRPLYLSRNHVVPGKRGVKNETELLEFLSQFKPKILYGTESLREIVDAFHHASFIVGPHGSLLANTIFCREDCLVIEYCASNRIDKSFLNKQKYASNYHQVITEADEDYNIFIDISDLSGFIM